MTEAAHGRRSLTEIRMLKTGDAFLARPSAVGFPDALFGRLTEICAPAAAAALTAAMGLVRDVQRRGEPTVWITPKISTFFPPDAQGRGVDLHTLTVVRVPIECVLSAVDKTVRSGGFGLVVADFSSFKPGPGRRGPANDAALSRLLGLAQKHDTAVVFLTRKDADMALGSLISLRVEAGRTTGVDADGGHAVTLSTVKDKRRSPGHRIEEHCFGPAGMC